MGIRESYNRWSSQYDTNQNKTRDMEAGVLRELVRGKFDHGLEIGCGTGKNSVYLSGICNRLTAVDFSEEMLAIARRKINTDHVRFIQKDIRDPWELDQEFDLAVISLVLEHIEKLEPFFQKLAAVLRPGALAYVAELHPFRQYGGSGARFETEAGTEHLQTFIHHVSDYTTAAGNAGLQLLDIKEYFDEDNPIPRILALTMRKAN